MTSKAFFVQPFDSQRNGMFEIHQAKFPVIINHEITVLPKKTNVNKVEVKVCKWLLASGAY